MIDVSVVTGTYNRLPHLKRFVESVRRSILPVLGYEIILVDGGSRDGTQAWAKAQGDVKLIEQGELLGAVKAFNAGFTAASGQYAIAGNDDVEFVGRSISRAWCFLEDNPEVGQACFQQKRGRSQWWHVEVMPAILDGRRITVHYGQVAMVRTWLGDKVGWWGDVTHTYGGDNELSANIWANGYQVVGVAGAGIIDGMADDELRVINKGDPKEMAKKGEHHPDTVAFYRKWPRGPTVSDVPTWGLPELGERRILYAPIIETAYPIVKEQKTGLRKALRKMGRVLEYDYCLEAQRRGAVGMRTDLVELARDWAPHLVLLQVHSPELICADTVLAIKETVPTARVLNWNGDYRAGHIDGPGGASLAKAFDCQCMANASEYKRYIGRDISAAFWQIGWEPAGVGHEPNGETPRHDVLFLANCYTEERKRLAYAMKSICANVSILGIYGWGWPDGMAKGNTLYDFETGCRLYRAAKVAVGDQAWPAEEGYVSNRLFQAMAAGGAVLCQQRFAGMREWLGLVEGEHLLCWSDHDELGEKIRWALTHEEERGRIAETGQRFVLEHHGFDARVRELEVINDERWGS